MAKKLRKTQKKRNRITSEVVELFNLRPERGENGETFFTAVKPAQLVDEEGWEPVGKIGEKMVLSGENSMKVENQEYELGGRVRGLVEGNDGSVMVDDGTGRVRRFERAAGGGLTPIGSEPDWEPVTITAVRHSVVEMTIQSMTFAGLPTTGTVGDRETLNKLGARLADAYSESAETARRRGVLIRPVVVRAVVSDDSGETLYRGPEVLVGADYLTEYVDSVSLDVGADGTSTTEKLILLPAYRLKVNVKPMTEQGCIERASKLTIEVSPQFHPNGIGVVSATVGKDGSGHRLTVTIPGAMTSLSNAQPERSAKLIESVIENFDMVKKTAKVFTNPYDRGVSEKIVTPSYPLLANELDCLKKAVMSEVSSLNYEERLVGKLNSPNRFSARHYSNDGAGTILAGNIERYRFAGYHARAMATGMNNSLGFRSMTTVTFRDGSSVSRLDSGAADAPVFMNPVAVYPGDDAVAVRLTVSYSDETVRTWSYALSPSRSGRFSIGVADEIDTLEGTPAEEEFDVPTFVTPVSAERMESVVVTMDSERPMTVTAAGTVDGSVTAIMSRPTSGGAWEFGRSRFAVGTSKQVVSAIVHENRGRIALNKLADCKIVLGSSITRDSAGMFYFVENGRVYRINGTTVIELKEEKLQSTDLDSIVYDKFTRRLIVGSSNGATAFHHLDPEQSMPLYLTPSLGPFNYLGNSGDKVYCATQSGLYIFPDSDNVEEDFTADIWMTVRVTTADPMRAIRRVDWPMRIDQLEGCVKVERCFMPKFRTGLLSGWLVDGPVVSTIRFPIVALSITKAYAIVEGTVTLGPDKHAYLALPE